MSLKTVTSPLSLYVAAWGNANAMEVLLPKVKGEENHNLRSPYALLAGFAFELALKSFIQASGATPAELRKIGHKLDAALAEGQQRGLILRDEVSLRTVIGKLNAVHRFNQMRYIPADVGSIPLPRPILTLTVLRDLLDDVAEQVPSIMTDGSSDGSVSPG